MNTILCLTVICAFAVLAQAEECRDISQCAHVTCPEANYMLECHDRQCTCSQLDNSGCVAKADCTDSNCRFGWHCVDSRCKCGYGFLGGIGK